MKVQDNRGKPTPPSSQSAAAASAKPNGDNKTSRPESGAPAESGRSKNAQSSADRLVQARTGAVGSLLNPAVQQQIEDKLDDLDLNRNLDGIEKNLVQGSRFLDGALGMRVGGSRIGSELSAVKEMGGSGQSKNPLDAANRANLAGHGAGQISQDQNPPADGAPPAEAPKEESSSTWEAVKNFASSVAGSLFGTTGGTAFGVLTANNTVEGKKDEVEGIKAFGRMKNGKYPHGGMSQVDDPFAPRPGSQPDGTQPDETPTPDGESSTPTMTHHDSRGIGARLGGHGGRIDDGVGEGGFVNEGATPKGKNDEVAEYAGDGINTAAINTTVLNGIESKINEKINEL